MVKNTYYTGKTADIVAAYKADQGAEAVAKANEIAIGRRDFAYAKTFRPYIVCY